MTINSAVCVTSSRKAVPFSIFVLLAFWNTLIVFLMILYINDNSRRYDRYQKNNKQLNVVRSDNPEWKCFRREAEQAAAVITDVVLRGLITDMIPPKRGFLEQKMFLIREMIHMHFASPISLAGFSESLGVDKAVIARKYKHMFHTTVNASIIERRLLHARRLLKNNYRVTESCFFSGFNDSGYFAKIFRKTMGMSPSEWKTKG